MKNRIKFSIVIAAAAILLGATSAQAQDWQAVKGMNVSVNELLHDFGTHPPYTKTEFEFQIRNDSTETFVIKNITTS